MQSTVKRQDVKKLIGKRVYAIRKNGSVVTGVLRGMKGNALLLLPSRKKPVQTKALLPLLLVDLLAVGSNGAGGFGGYGGYGGYGGFGGYGGYPGNGGYGGYPGFGGYGGYSGYPGLRRN